MSPFEMSVPSLKAFSSLFHVPMGYFTLCCASVVLREGSFPSPKVFVFEQEKINLENMRDFFVHNRPSKKNLLEFLHKFHGFREMSKI